MEEYRELSRVIGQLIRQLEQKRKRYMEEGLKGTGLNGPMYRYLLFLDRHPGSSQDFMAEHHHIDKANVAREARKLEELGYIVRRQNEDNRRQYKIYLTERGEALLPRIRSCLENWNTALVGGISEDKEQELVRLLQQMCDNISDLSATAAS